MLIIGSVNELKSAMDTRVACMMVGITHSTYYYWTHEDVPDSSSPRKQYTSARSLSESERDSISEMMVSEPYCDKTPYEIFYQELDLGNYHCSIRTMYRLLESRSLCSERRRGHNQRQYQKPELLATAPNQVWTWDITKLKGARRWEAYYLYVLLDIFSRYVVGWLLAYHQQGELGKELIRVSCERQEIEPGQLIIHSDNGSPMKSVSVVELMDNLKVGKSYNRPHVSNDNPYSESHFKTLKYRPEFPNRFSSIEQGREICRSFFDWYNNEHYHSGLNYLTPYSVHYGKSQECIISRQKVMDEAYQLNRDRFRSGPPTVSGAPESVWINKPENGGGPLQ